MTDTIEIIPTYENRQAFARWSLTQQPGGLTMTNHETWAVPAPLFADVPAELLEGAYIDGHVFRPALAGFEPDGDGYRPVADADPVADAKPVPRKRTPRKAAATAETAETAE